MVKRSITTTKNPAHSDDDDDVNNADVRAGNTTTTTTTTTTSTDANAQEADFSHSVQAEMHAGRKALERHAKRATSERGEPPSPAEGVGATPAAPGDTYDDLDERISDLGDFDDHLPEQLPKDHTS